MMEDLRREGLPSSDRLTHWVTALRGRRRMFPAKLGKRMVIPHRFYSQNTQLDETTHYARALMFLKAVGAKSIKWS